MVGLFSYKSLRIYRSLLAVCQSGLLLEVVPVMLLEGKFGMAFFVGIGGSLRDSTLVGRCSVSLKVMHPLEH
jgi:hypothetical protein